MDLSVCLLLLRVSVPRTFLRFSFVLDPFWQKLILCSMRISLVYNISPLRVCILSSFIFAFVFVFGGRVRFATFLPRFERFKTIFCSAYHRASATAPRISLISAFISHRLVSSFSLIARARIVLGGGKVAEEECRARA